MIKENAQFQSFINVEVLIYAVKSALLVNTNCKGTLHLRSDIIESDCVDYQVYSSKYGFPFICLPGVHERFEADFSTSIPKVCPSRGV